jgi:PTH1 family peptidyl-tRNA hydrolase
MKYLVVGLGNMGAEYADTRHNIGFNVLDAFAKASNTCFKTDRLGAVAEAKYKGRKLFLLKPSTYMNLSGKAVLCWLQKEKIPLERLLIITDDIALPYGTLRLKAKGSDGGHNGLKSVNQLLNTTQYPRLRFGVGSDFGTGRQVDYVLGKWNADEASKLDERLQKCTELIQSFVTIGIERTMNFFNGQ